MAGCAITYQPRLLYAQLVGAETPCQQRAGYKIEPVARYEIRAKVLSIERYRIGREADLSPADENVKARLLKVRKGEIVNLKGYLINVKHQDGWTWRSSLTREDSGAGSCELMWVSEVAVE